MRHSMIGASVLCAGLFTTHAAFAHAHLRTASPTADSTLGTAPSEVAINFTEGLEPRFSTIEVRDKAGTRVSAGEAHLAPGDNKHLAVGLSPLPAGIYTVIWHATSVDTHKTEGTFQFTVAP